MSLRTVRSGAIIVALFFVLMVSLEPARAFHTAPKNFDCPSKAPNHPDWQCDSTLWDEQSMLYVESDGSKAFLALDDASAGTADSFQLSSPTAGPTAAASSFAASTLPQLWNISLPNKLTQDYFFNTSRPVLGAIYFTHVINSANVAKKAEVTHIRAELFVDGQLAGGCEDTFSLSTPPDTWAKFSIMIWPEATVLKKGSSLYLHISRSGGLADFIIGTGSTHQSKFDIRYTPYDPFGGILYLKDGKIQEYDPGAEAGESAAGAGVAAAALLVVGRRRGVRAVSLVALLALSGCAAPGTVPESTEPSDYLTTTEPLQTEYAPLDEGDSSAGEVRGIVKSDAGPPLPQSHVSIIGTNFFATTDKHGSYRIINVPPGVHSLHVDHEGYQSFDGSLEVRRGNIAYANVTLFLDATKADNARPHMHGPFAGDLKEFEIWSGQLQWVACQTPVTTHYCSLLIPAAKNDTVPPGTGLIRITIEWTPGSGGATQAGVRITPPKPLSIQTFTATGASGSPGNYHSARLPGVPTNIPIKPTQADFGHQKFTNWKYEIISMPIDLAGPTRRLDTERVSLDVKIVAVKGVVPFEPAHADLWGSKDQLVVFDHTPRGPAGTTDTPADGQIKWRWYVGQIAQGQWNDKDWIPPGTAEVRGYLAVERGVQDGYNYILSYESNKCGSICGSAGWLPVPLEGTGDNRTFSFTPDANHTDQFYQPHSNWMFILRQGTGSAPGSQMVGTKVYLSVTAVREEGWKDDQFG